jgi:hypothetical protein
VYQQLQQDNTQLSAQILVDISRQLSSISQNHHAPATSAPSPSASFHPPRVIIAVNVLWFTSLALSLMLALLGIFVKQWLREYMRWTRISPLDIALQRRESRRNALMQWKVDNIVMTIPALLQLSMVLFLVGLLLLLHTLNRMVEMVIATTVGLTLSSVAAVIILPATHRAFPYKSPLSWAFVRLNILFVMYVGPLRCSCADGHNAHTRHCSALILLNCLPSGPTSAP